MDVSIIIVSWNTRDILRDCLRSVCDEAGPLSYEIIVVDNASTDDSVEMVRREFPQVRLIANAENRGFAAANNQGMAVAQGRYVLLLNSDTVVLDQAIVKTMAFADQNPGAAVIGCRVLNADRTLQPTCFMYPSVLNMFLFATYLYKLFPRSRFCGRERMTWWGRDDIRDVDVVTGCFMFVRRQAIEAVGVMDEGFFMYGEETDWCYRFKEAGWKIRFTPEPNIIHLGGASSKLRADEMYIQLRKSVLHFIRKHRSYPAYVAAQMLVVLFLALRIPYWLLVSLLKKRDRSESRRRVAVYAKAIRAVCVPSRSQEKTRT